jgi:hypothetical protein
MSRDAQIETDDEIVEKFDRAFQRASHWPTVWTICGIALFLGLIMLGEYMKGPPHFERTNDLPRIFSDPATGCEYLVYSFRGITPRLGPDGEPLCVAASKALKQ